MWILDLFYFFICLKYSEIHFSFPPFLSDMFSATSGICLTRPLRNDEVIDTEESVLVGLGCLMEKLQHQKFDQEGGVIAKR